MGAAVAVKEPAPSLFGRRDLLTRGGLAALAAAALGGLGLGVRTLWPRSGKTDSHTIAAGRPEDYLVGQVNQRLLQEHQVWVTRVSGGFIAYSALCTHLGCRLRYVKSVEQFRCMCHGSVFSKDGAVLGGPATRPMERVYLALSRAGELRVDPAVRYREERGEWARPGAFVAFPRRRSSR
jgi:cytochrome b6-f complex iron-sulfur subunit